MKKGEQSKEVTPSQSKLMRIGILLVSLIVGVILALFTMLSPP
jgi:hypothetical protein